MNNCGCRITHHIQQRRKYTGKLHSWELWRSFWSHSFHSGASPWTNHPFAEVIIQLHHGTVRLRPECDGFSWLFDYTIPVSDERMKEMYSVVQTNPYKTLMNFNLKEGSLAPVQRPMYSPGGSFIVTRAVIRRNPLSYYMRIVKSPLLNTLNDPPLGHILEWAWNDVFHSKCATDEKFICYGLTRTRTSAWLRGWWN